MKVKIKNGNLELEAEGTTHKEVFREIAAGWEEVFSSEPCGNCKKTLIRFRVRNVEKNKKKYEYFEKLCLSCGARLSYGQHQEGGTLFPKRKDSEGGPLEHRGWVKWTGKDDDEPGS